MNENVPVMQKLMSKKSGKVHRKIKCIFSFH